MSLVNPTRRQVLKAGLTGGFTLLGLPALASLRADDPYAPFAMGIQSYSLRGFSFEEAVGKAANLGLKRIEAFPGHLPATDDKAARDATLEMLKKAGVVLEGWGVQGFDGNEAVAGRIFDFAQAMGVKLITADPSPEALPILDELVATTGVGIGIHNHGPGSRYDKMESVQKAVQGRHIRLGVCVDTGHVLRSGEDPVDWVKALGNRVRGVHLKDVKDGKQWTVLGKGDLRLEAFIKALREIGFKGVFSLEYEENAKDPMDDLKVCLAATRAAIQATAG